MLTFWVPFTLIVALLCLALRHDILSRRIPNWLVVAGVLAGVTCNLFTLRGSGLFLSGGGLGLVSSLLGALAGLLIMLPLYLLRVMGAGDAKLMAAVGAFLGPMQVAGAALLTLVAGGILSLLAALWSRSLVRVLGNLRMMSTVALSGRAAGISLREVETTGRLPYAIAIASGTGLQLWLAAHGGWIFV